MDLSAVGPISSWMVWLFLNLFWFDLLFLRHWDVELNQAKMLHYTLFIYLEYCYQSNGAMKTRTKRIKIIEIKSCTYSKATGGLLALADVILRHVSVDLMNLSLTPRFHQINVRCVTALVRFCIHLPSTPTGCALSLLDNWRRKCYKHNTKCSQGKD